MSYYKPLTVQELIELLEETNPDLPIEIFHAHGVADGYSKLQGIEEKIDKVVIL